jgi:hypothetical protein
MSDPPRMPYRTGDEPETRPAPPPFFERAWTDVHTLGGSWAFYQVLLTAVIAVGIVGAAWPPAGAAAVLVAGVLLVRRHRQRRPVTLRAEVRDDVLTVRFHAQTMLEAPLSSVRHIVVDRTEIQRVTYHQGVGEPMPNTQVSGGVSAGRLAARLGDDRVVRLTQTAANDSACMEAFGKLRVFLRAHGWKPVDER